MIHPYAYRAGIIAAVVSVLYYFVAYIAGVEMFTNMWAPWILIVAYVVYYVISLKKIKAMQGSLSFKQGFLNFIVMAALMIVASNLTSSLIVGIIDPEFGAAVNETLIEKVIGMMEMFGARDIDITEAVVKMEEGFESQNTFLGLITNIGTGLFWFALIGLIVAAVMKSKKEVFIETVD